MIRVFLVEDQMLVREGIRSLLRLAQDIEVVGEARDGEEAVARIPGEKPDVVLLDMRMPKRDGLWVLEELKRSGTLPPTIILTTFDDDSLVLQGVRAGARGFLLKDVSLEQLTNAIRTVAAGGTLIQPAITDRLLRGMEPLHLEFPSFEKSDPLTEREKEVLRLLAGGYSNREIAQALGVAEGTAKNHISSILLKMGVRDRTRAVLRALESGLI
jgi:DNA-binding NarL/FixJ family response regulator